MLKRKLSPQTLAVIKYMIDRPKADYYGLELIEATGMPAGTIYPILTRLEEVGWIGGEWESFDRKDKGRRRRRYYVLTATGKKDGKKYLADGIKELSRLGLLDPPKPAPARAAKPAAKKAAPKKAAAKPAAKKAAAKPAAKKAAAKPAAKKTTAAKKPAAKAAAKPVAKKPAAKKAAPKKAAPKKPAAKKPAAKKPAAKKTTRARAK